MIEERDVAEFVSDIELGDGNLELRKRDGRLDDHGGLSCNEDEDADKKSQRDDEDGQSRGSDQS